MLALSRVKERFADTQTVFVDVRSPTDFTYGRIRGAVSLPFEEFEERFAQLRPRLEAGGTVVVYCKSVDCGKSLWAALRLREAGLGQVAIYPAGWNEWFLHGYPIEANATR